MTLGTDGHEAWAVAAAQALASVTLDPSLFENSRGMMSLGHLADADGDGAWNRLEWVSVLAFYTVTTPTMTEAAIYVDWALDPTLPDLIDIGLDLPDGDGTNWDYSYLPQGTVTFQSETDLPIEVRVLDPPGREDVPVTLGTPVQIPLGAEILVTLADGANPDWFYTWSAPGNMIDGSGEKTERFRLMASATIKPVRRPVHSITLPTSPTGENAYTLEWSGVGPFGHMIASGLGPGGSIVDAPLGSFLKVRAYKLKQPSGGVSANTGSDKQYARRWDYTFNGDTWKTYSSNPVFNAAAVSDITPSFTFSAPNGLLTHTVSGGDGAYPFIDQGNAAITAASNGGLLNSVTTLKPAPTDNNVYPLRVTAKTAPGFEVAGWTGSSFAVLVLPIATGAYSKESGGETGGAEQICMLELKVDWKVNNGKKHEAYVVAYPAEKYYPNFVETEVVLWGYEYLTNAFLRWEGEGIAYEVEDENEQNPVLSDPRPLNSEPPITDSIIGVKAGDTTTDVKEPSINAIFGDVLGFPWYFPEPSEIMPTLRTDDLDLLVDAENEFVEIWFWSRYKPVPLHFIQEWEEDSGGHISAQHRIGQTLLPHPIGTGLQEPHSVAPLPGPLFLQIYRFIPPEFSGKCTLTTRYAYKTFEHDIKVAVPGLIELAEPGEGDHYDLIGEDLSHPSNHWVRPYLHERLLLIADEYFERYDTEPVQIKYNDCSLEAGGQFDVERRENDIRVPARWETPHVSHRVGLQVDVRKRDNTIWHEASFQEIVRDNQGSPAIHGSGSNIHYHLDFSEAN